MLKWAGLTLLLFWRVTKLNYQRRLNSQLDSLSRHLCSWDLVFDLLTSRPHHQRKREQRKFDNFFYYSLQLFFTNSIERIPRVRKWLVCKIGFRFDWPRSLQRRLPEWICCFQAMSVNHKPVASYQTSVMLQMFTFSATYEDRWYSFRWVSMNH